MQVTFNAEGIGQVSHKNSLTGKPQLILRESSARAGESYPDGRAAPEFLWVGDFHLTRSEIEQLTGFLQFWLERGRLPE